MSLAILDKPKFRESKLSIFPHPIDNASYPSINHQIAEKLYKFGEKQVSDN
jgi:hypothetical protein